jgi:hypothetical protein
MNKSNYKLKLALAAAGGLLASGTAMAGAPAPATPIAFDQYTVTNGVITDTSTACSTDGWSCVTLDATAAGIFTQQVTDPNTGISYLRTIIVEDDATGSPGTSAGNLEFSLEQQVYANGINRNNVALKQIINTSDLTQNVRLYEGAFRSDGTLTDPTSGGNGAEMALSQIVSSVGQTFQQWGVNGNVAQRVSQSQGVNPGRFVYQVVAGNGQGLYEPTAAGQLGGGDMPALAYSAGDALSVVWLGVDLDGTGDASTRQFGFQEYRNYGTANGANVVAGTASPVATSRLVSNQLGDAPWQFVDNGAWDWDSNVFQVGNPPTPPQ